MRRPVLGMLAATLVVGSLALGGTALGQTAGGIHQLRLPGISIHNDAYSPATARVLPGQAVGVTNFDGEEHSLTARDGSFSTGIYTTGTRYITAPMTPGRYQYSCLVHGPTVMKGVLIVEA